MRREVKPVAYNTRRVLEAPFPKLSPVQAVFDNFDDEQPIEAPDQDSDHFECDPLNNNSSFDKADRDQKDDLLIEGSQAAVEDENNVNIGPEDASNAGSDDEIVFESETVPLPRNVFS